jgi:CO dehydrogenase nickel-insertion accessory protein CooC1
MTINIEISGHSGVGKTTVAAYINRILNDHGFDVTVTDDDKQAVFDSKATDEALARITTQPIKITCKQLPRNTLDMTI